MRSQSHRTKLAAWYSACREKPLFAALCTRFSPCLVFRPRFCEKNNNLRVFNNPDYSDSLRLHQLFLQSESHLLQPALSSAGVSIVRAGRDLPAAKRISSVSTVISTLRSDRS